MSNTSVKVAIALFMVLAAPAASFARALAATGNFGAVRPNAGLIGESLNQMTDPSGMRKASGVSPIAPPRITVPTIPRFK
jgi:hypothetical protein